MNMQTKALQQRRKESVQRNGKVSIGHRLALNASRGGDEWLDPRGVALCFTGTKRRRSLKSCAAKAAAAVAAFFGALYVIYYHFGDYIWSLLP